MIKEVPILFSTEMVKAIIDGRKTMTRRIISKQNSKCGTLLTGDGQSWEDFDFNDVVVDGVGTPYGYLKVKVPSDGTRHRIFCKFNPKDTFTDNADPTILYVRESFYQYGRWVKNGTTKTGKQSWRFKPAAKEFFNIRFLDNPPARVQKPRHRVTGFYKRQGIFLPKNESRIWLEVVSVRAERLQDINRPDAIAEGIEPFPGKEGCYKNYIFEKDWCDSIGSYQTLWESINGHDSWESNPWVWVIQFKVLSTTGKGIVPGQLIFKDGVLSLPDWSLENQFLSNHPNKK